MRKALKLLRGLSFSLDDIGIIKSKINKSYSVSLSFFIASTEPVEVSISQFFLLKTFITSLILSLSRVGLIIYIAKYVLFIYIPPYGLNS